MIYEEGTAEPPGEATYKARIGLSPNVNYLIKLEVLRNDLGGSDEKVNAIIFDGTNVGECNPPGSDYDCDFYDCTSKLTLKEVVSTTGLITIELKYVGHSKDCDCDKNTWECSPEDSVNGRSPMVAAARITLTQLTLITTEEATAIGCPLESGICVDSEGADISLSENSKLIQLDKEDDSSVERVQKCLRTCRGTALATGCQLVSGSTDNGCYVHLGDVADVKESSDTDSSCWVFSKCTSGTLMYCHHFSKIQNSVDTILSYLILSKLIKFTVF